MAHQCPFAADICAMQTGWVHVPDVVAIVLGLLVLLAILRFGRREVRG